MFMLIMSDLKNKLKNPITWFVIIILCTLLALNMLETKEERKTRSFVNHNVIGFRSTGINWSEQFINDKQKEAYPIVYDSLKLYDEIILDAEKATLEKDYREMTRLISFYNLLTLKMNNLSMDPVSDIMLKNDIYDIWIDISKGIPYEEVDFRPVISRMPKGNNQELLSAKYHHNLYINEIEPIYNDEINNVTTIYKYFYNIIPMVLFLIVIILAYNNINREKKNGSIKLILTQSVNRSKFYLNKWISSVIHIFIILLIPPLLISIITGFFNRFVTLKYPSFYLNNIFTRFKPIPNYFDRMAENYRVPELYPRVFGHVAPEYYGRNVIPHKDVDIIPFYKYLLIVIVLLVLFIMFAVAFIQLISAIIDNEIVSLVVSSVLIGGATYISLPFTQNVSYNLSPFTFFKISRIVEGTYNVTVLTSVVVMITSILILLISGCMYFKKKEI